MASKSAGVIAAMKSLKYSIGYADLADAATAGFPFAAVKNGAGQFIKPSVNALQDLPWQAAYELSGRCSV